MMRLVALFAMIALLTTACSSGDQEAGQSDAGQAGEATVEKTSAPAIDPADYDLSGQPVTLAGITFTPPGDWTDTGPSGMRKASYYFGPAEGDTDSGTVTVFYFGPTGGGSIDANIDRWVSQMVQADGSDPKASAERYNMETAGMPVHVVTADGAYTGSMGGGGMGGATDASEGYHLIGAVVEGPEGNVFFKLTGPKRTAEAMGDEFLAMIKAIEKA